jgi:hypothetical protein
MALVAKNAFGDLFLRDKSGQIHWLDVAIGKLTRIADSEKQSRELARSRFWSTARAGSGSSSNDNFATQCRSS